MKKGFIWTIIVLGLAIGGYYIWSETGRARNKKTGWTSLPTMKTHFETSYLGADNGPRKLIAIQPYLTPRSYSTTFNLYVTLYLYVKQLKESGLLDSQSVLVFPGHIGDGLVVSNEKEAVYTKSSFDAARSLIMRSNGYSYLSHYLSAPPGAQRSERAMYSLKAADMSEQYQACFSELARQFGVTIVAGSIRLPEPRLANGHIRVGRGTMTEVAVVFDREGRIVAPLYTTSMLGRLADSTRNCAYPAYGLDLKWTQSANRNAGAKCLLVMVKDTSAVENETLSVEEANWPDIDLSNVKFTDSSGDMIPIGYSPAGTHSILQVTLNGDLWDMPMDGAILINRHDSLYGLPGKTRKGRMLVCHLGN